MNKLTDIIPENLVSVQGLEGTVMRDLNKDKREKIKDLFRQTIIDSINQSLEEGRPGEVISILREKIKEL